MSKITFWMAEDKEAVVENVISRLRIDGHEVTVCRYDGKESTFRRVDSEKTDLLITFDCKGYELRTLTGGISLNFVRSKVMNVLLGNEFKERALLKGNPISISHFFCFADKNLLAKYQEEYPQIPNVRRMSRQNKETDEDMIYIAIREVLKECLIV